MSVNKAILVGRLGKDPEIRSTQDGKEIATFNLATSERWKDKTTGEKKEKTEWHKVVVFNAPIVSLIKSYVKKGSHLYVEGQICTRKWQDKEGKDVYSTEIVLQAFSGVIQLLDSKKEGRPENDDYSAHDKGYDPAVSNPYRTGESTISDSNTSPSELNDEIPF